ncbi:MAG: DMT family transporter [Propionicimonas sp.]|uniref:DMT family transporter n=1 Tax=Propionicimonas sp. TaxID=1955623 RepID=UPI002B213995|nr:DMT family transporter [Propionicimonas sp.]MEA4944229.1 DMT family transporter [Propionicimonas sp.]MEA5116915.1 DMT family transporter [Propionicimonas sp.]
MNPLATRRLRANGLLLLASAIWGFAFAAQRLGAEYIGPFTFNGLRFAMGAAALVPVVWWLDRRRGVPVTARRAATRAVVVPGILVGTLLAVAVGLQQAAMSYTTAGNAAFITGLYMVFVPLVAAFRGHRSSPATIVGICCALAGLYLISVTDDFTIGLGDLLVLISAFVWTAEILLIERYAQELSALRFSIAQFTWCALLSCLAALVLDPAPFTGVGHALIPLLYGGLISVGIAYTLQVIGQRDALASHAALIMSCEAVFGALGGALILHENMGVRGYAGAALMAAGIIVAQLATVSASRAAPDPSAEVSAR